MKTLVVYDSNFGNTQKIAERIAKILDAKAVTTKLFEKSDLDCIEFLVLGSPIIGWKPTVKIQEFLSKLEPGILKGRKATTFDTRVKLFIHGDAKDKMAAELAKLGAEIFTTSEAFYVAGSQNAPYLLDGEMDRAEAWAEKLLVLFK